MDSGGEMAEYNQKKRSFTVERIAQKRQKRTTKRTTIGQQKDNKRTAKEQQKDNKKTIKATIKDKKKVFPYFSPRTVFSFCWGGWFGHVKKVQNIRHTRTRGEHRGRAEMKSVLCDIVLLFIVLFHAKVCTENKVWLEVKKWGVKNENEKNEKQKK